LTIKDDPTLVPTENHSSNPIDIPKSRNSYHSDEYNTG